LKKIVYMGTPNYAKEILEVLIDADDIEVSLVLTQPDRVVGRKRILTPPSVKVLAKEHNIEVLQPHKLIEDGIKEAIEKVSPDFIIVAAFGQILPKNILDIAPCINLHASLLPQYRGASPIQQSLLNGDKITGVTSMLMEEGLDTGDILEKIEFEIPKDMRLIELTDKLTKDASILTLSTIRNYANLTPIPQDNELSTLCKKIKKSDGEIDFENTLDIYNRYRAFEGWPEIYTKDGIKLDSVELIDEDSQNTKQTILEITKKGIVVACSNGTIKIGLIQPPSKKPMNAKAYCVTKELKVGDIIFQ